MPLDLDQLEQRILGVLVEKEMTVPEAYPLTLNALVSGCNQKSNREPKMSVEPYEVEGALRSLMDRGFVVQVEKVGGRAPRYRHQATEQLAVDAADMAILSELLCRGPQAPGALKSRASRMHAFSGQVEIEARLSHLAARPVPYVRQLERRPREHANRWEHRLGPAAADAPPDETPALTLTHATAPAVDAVPPPLSAPAAPPDWQEAFDALRTEIDSLRERLDRLEGR